MYANQNAIVDEMKINSSDKHLDSRCKRVKCTNLKNVSLNVSLDPLVMVSNLNTIFKKRKYRIRVKR